MTTQQTDLPAFEIKGSTFTMIVMEVTTAQPAAIEAQIQSLLSKTPDFFNHDPVVIDLKGLNDPNLIPDFRQISTILRRHKLVPVGVSNASVEQEQAALSVGMGRFEGMPVEVTRVAAKPEPAKPAAVEPVRPAPPAAEPAYRPTKIITTPVRTGQQIYAKGGDLIIMAPVSAGAEVLADGSIHIYAPLRGRALAGVRGDTSARIFSRMMEAELVSVAGCYRMIDEQLLASLNGQPVQVFLKGDKLVIESL